MAAELDIKSYRAPFIAAAIFFILFLLTANVLLFAAFLLFFAIATHKYRKYKQAISELDL